VGSVREKSIEQIFFFLAQYTVKSHPISKNLGNVAKLPDDIQKK